MRRFTVLFAAVAVASLLAGGMAFGQGTTPEPEQEEYVLPEIATSEDGVRYVPGELVVADKDTAEIRKVDAEKLDSLKAKAKDLEAKLKNGRAKIDGVSEGENVQVSPNVVYRLHEAPNDPRYDEQYHLRQIGMPGAWNEEKGLGARVCVVDSGWHIGHPDLNTKVVAQRDVVNNDGLANDLYYHGTAVAGIAAAETNNSFQVAGVGWRTNLAIAKATDGEANLTVEWIKQAINWCGNTGGVSVINMSFGGPANDVISAEIQEQHAAGRNLVASAGNNGPDAPTQYPAGYGNVIGVGSSNPDGSLWAYSAQGPEVDLVAPSGGIVTTTLDDRSTVIGPGTSFAAPQVAGVAAMLRARGLSRDQAEGRLLQNANDRGPAGNDTSWGHGFLDANCAVSPNEAGC